MRRPWLLALPALALLPAACGGGSLSLDPVAKAADQTSKARSSRMAMTMNIAFAGQKVAMHGSGVVDYVRRTARMGLDLRAPGSGSLRMDEIVQGQIVYLRMPMALMGSKVPAGKTWLRVDLDKPGSGQLGSVGPLSQTGSTDPADELDYLRATSGKVEKVGTETVRGTAATHYKATVDLDKVADRAPKEKRDQARKTVRQLEAVTGLKTLPMDVWVGSDGLVRRLSETLSFNSGLSMTMKMTIDLYDFGTAVHVQAPPASSVYAAPS